MGSTELPCISEQDIDSNSECMHNFEKLLRQNSSRFKDTIVVNESDKQIVVSRTVSAQEKLSEVLECSSLSVLYEQN